MKYDKNNPLRVFEAFAGYGSQSLALKRLKKDFPEFDYKCIGYSEIDKYAITAFDALHEGESVKNLGDICFIDTDKLPDFDLFTMSSPCQDFSSAGKQAGGEEGSGTRSSLLWECSRIIEAKRPKYVLLENVSDLIGKNFVKVFNKWQKRLEGFGYVNFLAPSFPMDWAKKRTKAGILNAKNYGVPQNRERVFMLSIRDDLDKPVYNFPKPFKLEQRLKDRLEQEVDEIYYLSKERVLGLLNSTMKEKEAGRGFEFVPLTGEEECGRSVTTNAGGRKTDNFIMEQVLLNGSSDGCASTITTGHHRERNITEPKGGHREMGVLEIFSEPYIAAMRGREAAVLTPKRTEYGKAIRKQYEAHEINEQRKNIQQLEPRTDGLSNTITTVAKDNLVIEPSIMNVGNLYDNNEQAGRIYNPDGICPTLDNMASGGLKQPKIISPGHGYFEGAVNEETCPTIKCSAMQAQHFVSFGYRIRRLTERELYRLMDVDDEDIDVLFKTSIPRTQHAKLAGNSIVVNVLYHIFRKAFIETGNENSQLTLF